jgi:hypothetical protein
MIAARRNPPAHHEGERAAHDDEVLRLTSAAAALPDFSAFHDGFR